LGAALGRSGRGNSTWRCGLVFAGRKALAWRYAAIAMTHIAIQEKRDGKVVEWMEHVSDEQYRKQ
jgi:hypothetical protein